MSAEERKINEKIVQAYIAQNPEYFNTIEIVRDLATTFGMSERSIRQRLVIEGVYVKALRDSVANKEKKQVLKAIKENYKSNYDHGMYKVGKDFGYTKEAINDLYNEYTASMNKRVNRMLGCLFVVFGSMLLTYCVSVWSEADQRNPLREKIERGAEGMCEIVDCI